MTRRWLLDSEIDWDDVDFINNFDYDIHDPTLLDANDSGWRDASTNYVMLHRYIRITFNIELPEDLTALLYRFGDKLKPAEDLTITHK